MNYQQARYQKIFNGREWESGTYFTTAGNLVHSPSLPELRAIAFNTDAVMRRICDGKLPFAVVVYGTHGSGKTRHAEALRKLFNKAQVIESDDDKRIFPGFPDDALVMTSDMQYANMQAGINEAYVVHIATALRALGISNNT